MFKKIYQALVVTLFSVFMLAGAALASDYPPDKEVTGLTVTPAKLSMNVGDTYQFKATAKYIDGTTFDVTEYVDWEVDDTWIAKVDDQGKVTAKLAGEATVTASYVYGKEASADITIRYKVQSLTADVDKLQLAPGEETEIAVIADYGDFTEDVTFEAVWTSTKPAVAKLEGNTVIAGNTGTTTLTCAYMGYIVKIAVTVEKEIDYLEASPDDIEIPVNSGAVPVKVYAVYTDDTKEDITSKCTFESNNTAVAKMKGNSVVPVALGFDLITATYGEKFVDVPVEVKGALKAVVPSIKSVTLKPGETYSVASTAVYTDGSQEDVTGSIKYSTNQKKVALFENGIITAKAKGSTTVVGKYGNKFYNVRVTVK